MNGAGIWHGDKLVVDRSIEPKHGLRHGEQAFYGQAKLIGCPSPLARHAQSR